MKLTLNNHPTMKLTNLRSISAAVLAFGTLHAQPPADSPPPPNKPLTESSAIKTQILISDDVAPSPAAPELSPEIIAPAPSSKSANDAAKAATSYATVDSPKQEIKKSDEGFIIKAASLNDIFQFLAKSAGRQYFHNAKIAGPEYLVTGHLNDGKPLQQMEELAFMYSLTLHTKGDTIYALTQTQLSQLPSAEFHYQLRYLRPTDMEQIKELIKPMLSPGTGIVNFEPKTNTIVIIDSTHRIEQARELLHGIDKAKGQIVVETKILRINNSDAKRTGVNWSNSLGKDGTSLNLARDLNSVFGLPTQLIPSSSGPAQSNLVLSPIQVSGVLRALSEVGLASQVSNPTLITEDNEQATISIIDRIPIITTTSTANTTGGNPTVTEEVRYKIDKSDKTIDTDPDKHREIGISLVVTPTLLPDGTVRMKMRPRSAQIVEQIVSISGNKYPRVTESMVESIARVPDGYSLVVGGFYGEAQTQGKSKIPILGDIPVLNFFFKSKEATQEKTSLVFVITPKSYDPTNRTMTRRLSSHIRSASAFDLGSNSAVPDPKPALAEPLSNQPTDLLMPDNVPSKPTNAHKRLTSFR
jgi:type II secretory pathway component GspD/PulD (secretin)